MAAHHLDVGLLDTWPWVALNEEKVGLAFGRGAMG